MASNFAQTSEQFLASLDAEIDRLQRMRSQLTDVLGVPAQTGAGASVRRTRAMSEEGRQRISAAQKARWAKQNGKARSAKASTSARKTASKKTTSAKPATKKVAAKKAPVKKVAVKKATPKNATPKKAAAASTTAA